MGPIQTYHDLISWLRRRWRLILLCTVLGVMGGLVAAIGTERVYSASAVIQVVNPVIVAAEETAAAPDVTRRVQMIEQRLMSREALLDLAERYNLFGGAPISPLEQVALMRQTMSISAIAAAQQGFSRDGSLSALVVSVSHSNPETVAAVANDLAGALVRQSADSRQINAQQALEFFRGEENRLEAGIDSLETEIAAYRSQNEAFLPEAVAARRAEQASLTTSLLELQQTLTARENELATQDQASQRAVTQRRIQQLNDEIEQITLQSAALNGRIAEIQSILEAAPRYEQQLIALNRRMEQLQDQLTAAAERRREAELGSRIEDDQQSERFELLEAALVPEHPISTSRKKVALMGVLGGLGLGLFLAYVMEWLQPVLRTAQRMERDLQLRPVISIPFSMPVRERRRRHLIWGFGAVVLIGAALMVAVLSGLI